MLIHLEKKPPKRRLTEKQRQSIMGLCIALGALLVTLCVVILIRMDRKKDDSILKLADVEDYTQYTEEEFQEIVDNDDYTHLGWFYYNLPMEQQKDIFARFPFLNNENLQKFSYVSEDEVTDDMEVIGKDTYNDTDLLLVREYVSPIQTARELYDESYQKYQDAVSEKMENGTYEEFLEEHRKELEDEDSETIYRSPEILYKWWKDDGTTKDVMLPNATDKDLSILSSGLECDFHISFLRFGANSDHQLSDYSKDSAGARKFLDDYSNCAGAENNGSYSDSMANKLLGILKQRGMGTKVTIQLSRNERCSDVYDPEIGGDDTTAGATQTDKDGDKGVYITSITIGADAPNDLTISGYDRYLQIPSGKIDGDTDYANIYADKNGVPNKDKDGHYYYTHDVAIIDFCYEVPANYVPSHSDVTCFKYSGARFSTYTYNYAKDMLGDRLIFKKDVGWAGKATLGFLCDSEYQNDINTLSGNINTSTQNLRYGSTQTITKVTNKNNREAGMTQVKYTDGVGEYYEKKTKKQEDENKNLDNFTVQINIHENTKQGLGRTEKLNAIRWNPQNDNDRFLRNALSTYGGDMGAVLYITLVQNTETLRFDLGLNGYNTKNKWVDTSNNSNIWDNEIKIDSDNAAHGSKRVLKGTTGSTASVSVFDKYRLVGHKLRYVKVQRNVHPSSDQPDVFAKLPSGDFKAKDDESFITKNVFAWGMGGFHLGGYLSAGDSNNDNAGIMNEGVWMRTNLARGEDAVDTSNISYPTGNEVKTTYTFMNQNYQLMENSANNDLHFYYNNSTPKVRVILGAGNGDNTVEKAASDGLGPDLINQDDPTQLNNFKTDIGITLNSDRATRLRNLKSTDNKNVAILNYEKDTDGIQTYLLGVKTTNKGNIRGRLGGWLAEAGFTVYDTEDYENSSAGLHGKIPRIGSYKIKRSTPDDIKSKSEGTAADEIVSDRLYEINMAGNLNGDNKFNKYSLTKNNNYQNVDPVEVTLMCRDRAITDNNGNGDFKRRSVKKVKIKLYFINSQEMAGARVDTSHMFRVSDVKEKLNPDRFSHTGFKKTKTFELLKLNPTNNQYERVGQNYFSGTDATISQLDFFDKRLTVGNYKLTSKIQYSHPESNTCKHNYSPIRSTASPGHPVDNRCSVCHHGPGKHALLPDSSGKHHCHVCCQTLSNNNHLEWSDDAGEVNIEVYNDIPEIFSKDNTITEEQKVDTTTLYSMFDSVSDLQDTNIHYTDPNVNVLDQGCDSCGCGGDYAVLGNGAWNNNVYTETLAQKNVIDPFYQVNTGGIALNERLKGGEYSPGSFWGYPASSSITDGDQATASASSTLYVKPILYTSVKYKDLYFHTNETISQKDLLDNISAETGYARGTSVNDPVTKEIYSTNGLFVQATDNPNQTLNNMKWNIPLVRFEEGKICDGEGDKPSEAANCRKANSTEKEKVYEVSIKCTHPRSASLVYTESFKVHIVNDPPHAEAITEFDLHVGEEWTEEMFFKWWSCNAYDFEDGDKAAANTYNDKIPAKIEFLKEQPTLAPPLDNGNRAYNSETDKISHDLPNNDTTHNRYRINKSQNSILKLGSKGLKDDGDTYLHRFKIIDWGGEKEPYKTTKTDGTNCFNTSREVKKAKLRARYYDEDGAYCDFDIIVNVKRQDIPTPTPSDKGTPTPSITPGPSLPIGSPTPTPSGGGTPTPSITPGPSLPIGSPTPTPSGGGTPTPTPGNGYHDSKQYKTRYISKDFIDELPEYGGLAYDNTWSKSYCEDHHSDNFNNLWHSLHTNVDDANNTNNWEGCQFVFVFDKEDIKEYQNMIYNYAVTGKLNNNVPTWDFNDALWKKLEENNNIKKSINMEHKCVYVTEETRPATCTEKGAIFTVCKTCGNTNQKEELEPLGHNYEVTGEEGRGDCTQEKITTKTCSRCGDIQTEKSGGQGHQWVNYRTVEATCGSEGFTEQICSVCKDEDNLQKINIVPATGKHTEELVKRVEATCTEDGYIWNRCTVCEAETKITLPKLTHDFGDSQTSHSPSNGYCTDTYKKYKVCKRAGCGYVETEEEKSGVEDHAYDYEYKKYPTCTEEGTTIETCTNNNHLGNKCTYVNIITPAALGHAVVEENPTTESDGYLLNEIVDSYEKYLADNKTGTDYSSLFYRKLDATKETSRTTIKSLDDLANGEDYVWTLGKMYTVTKPYVCSFKTKKDSNGNPIGAEIDLDDYNGTCKLYCARSKREDWNTEESVPCGAEINTLDFRTSHGDKVKEHTVAPKCHEYGYTYKKCEWCGAESEHYNLIAPTHDYNYVGIEATTLEGTVNLLGGDFNHAGEGYQEKTVNGVVWADVLFEYKYQVCRSCHKHIRWQPTKCTLSGHSAGWGNTYNEAELEKNWFAGYIHYGVLCNLGLHDYATETQSDPTCTENGYLKLTCKHSGCASEVLNYKKIDALGHDSVYGGTADCHRKCSRCNAVLGTTHNRNGGSIVSKNATCTEKGKHQYTCSCGYKFEVEDIDKVEHTPYTSADLALGVVPSDYIGDGVEWKDYFILDENIRTITNVKKCTFELDYDSNHNPVGAHVSNSTDMTGSAATYCRYCKTNIGNCSYMDAGMFVEEKEGHEWNKAYKYKECSACGEKSGNYNISSGSPGLYNGDTYIDWKTLTDSNIITVNALNVITGVDSSRLIGKLRIPDTIIGIDDGGADNVGVFSNCSGLEEIEANNINSLENYAFSGCTGLKKATINGTYTILSDGVFQACSSLETVNIPSGITSIGNSAFYKCGSLKFSVDFGSYPNLTKIGDFAFYECRAITGRCYIGNKVEQIGKYAFSSCSGLNEGIYINTEKGTDTIVGECVFSNCSNVIWISSNVNSPYGMYAHCNRVIETVANSKVIGAYAFESVGLFSERTGYFCIGGNITSIGQGAFSNLRTKELRIGTETYSYVESFKNRLLELHCSIGNNDFGTITLE